MSNVHNFAGMWCNCALISRANAITAVVLPSPVGPFNSQALEYGSSAKLPNAYLALAGSRHSESCMGRYFSTSATRLARAEDETIVFTISMQFGQSDPPRERISDNPTSH